MAVNGAIFLSASHDIHTLWNNATKLLFQPLLPYKIDVPDDRDNKYFSSLEAIPADDVQMES
jgi:hypothetical protein